MHDLRASGALAALLGMIATGHAAGLSPIRAPVVEKSACVRIAAPGRFETFPRADRAIVPASDGALPSYSDRGAEGRAGAPALATRADVNETAPPPIADAQDALHDERSAPAPPEAEETPRRATEVDDARRDEQVAPATHGIDEKKGARSSGQDVPEQEKETTAVAPEQQAKETAPADLGDAIERMCSALESAAAAHGLPVEFFVRVIWEESRFQPTAVGPVTRSGHRAQGIAQFMPYTAAERGLLDPFNPHAALPEAAEFLAELRSKFGNLGLAAAAYNAGPARVRGFIDGLGGMPGQTRHYVRAITGRSIEHWVARGREGEKDEMPSSATCRQLAALLKEQPNSVMRRPEREGREAALRPFAIPERRIAVIDHRRASRVPEGPKLILAARKTNPAQARGASLPASEGNARKASQKTASAHLKSAPNSPAKPAKPTGVAKRPITVALVAPEPKPARSGAASKRAAQKYEIAAPAPKTSGGRAGAQDRKAVPVRIASLATSEQTQEKSSAAKARSKALPAASAKQGKSTVVASRTPSETPASSKRTAKRLQAFAPERTARENAPRRVAARTTGSLAERDGAASQGRTGSLPAKQKLSPSTAPEKKEKAINAARPSASAKLSEIKPAAKGARARSAEAMKAADERLKKAMQICRGC